MTARKDELVLYMTEMTSDIIQLIHNSLAFWGLPLATRAADDAKARLPKVCAALVSPLGHVLVAAFASDVV
jgi:hypothetical protein